MFLSILKLSHSVPASRDSIVVPMVTMKVARNEGALCVTPCNVRLVLTVNLMNNDNS